MRRLSKRKTNNNLVKILSLLFITTVIVTCLSLAKYKSTMAEMRNTKVAVPIVNKEGTVILEDLKPRTEKEYEFSINNSAEETTETTMKYTIKLETKSDLPLTITLHEKQEDGTISENLLDNAMETQEKVMTTEKEVTTNYILKVKWDDTYKDYRYSNEIDYINIIVDSEQVD